MHDLVRALEDDWQAILDQVLRPLSTSDVGRLAPKLAALSQAYNAGQAEGAKTKLPIEARIAFSFPRDVPKGAAAVRELVATGALATPADRPLRVLDLGAGLGAMTWGVFRALGERPIEALLVDEDREVLAKAEAIARAAQRSALTIATRTASLASFTATRTHDLVILGQVLSEIAPQALPEERTAAHVELVERVLREMVAADGSLVIVEPALRDRTRQLHVVRDRLLELGAGNVFAPCLHMHRCPALSVEGEWCHEDLEVDLPPWLVPLARAAGLRYQGLTFSYLVLRKDGRTMGAGGVRAISNLIASKGKAEVVVCGADGARRKLRVLDRDRGAPGPEAFAKLRRGDVVTIDGVDDRGRVGASAHVRIDVGAARG